MTRRARPARILAAALAPALLLAGLAAAAAPRASAYRPRIAPRDFSARVDNPWLPLVPGTTLRYAVRAGAIEREELLTVTRGTRRVMGVTCVEVHDMVLEHGRMVEETRDWYAQDRRGNVWYFGEATSELTARGRDNAGSWEAGFDRAQPGIVMPARPRPGAPYRQEYRPGVAEDMGRVVALGDSVRVPFGAFAGCVRTREWSPLEPGASETKWYARGVGCVRTESSDGEVTELVSVSRR